MDVLSKHIDMIVIGGSHGAVEAVLKIVESLSPGFRIPMAIVIHLGKRRNGNLTDIIAHRTKMKVKEPEDKESIEQGHIYLAAPDYHLLIEPEGLFSFCASELVHYSRPAIDVTFESAARVFGNKLAAILLSGANHDGTAGLAAVKQQGGFTMVQDPLTAESTAMPRHAIDTVRPHQVANIEEITNLLNTFNKYT